MWYNLLDVGLHDHIRTAEIVGSSVRSGEISHMTVGAAMCDTISLMWDCMITFVLAEIVGSSVRSGEISHTSPISIVIHPQYNPLSVQS